MFDLLLESSHRDNSNKRSNIGFGQEIMELASIEVYFTHVMWSSDHLSERSPFQWLLNTGFTASDTQ